MSDFDDLPEVDSREREPKDGEYRIQSFGSGFIVCTTPVVKLVDFYRTQSILASESGKPVVGPGADRMPSQGGSTPPPGATPQNMKGGQV